MPIWRDKKLQGNDDFGAEIIAQLERARIMVSILSPSYVTSEWCLKELNLFCDVAEAHHPSRLNKSQIFKVIKTPLPIEQHPRRLQELLGYEFYELLDKEKGKAKEFIAGERKFDDVFILLINGLVFKFFGSTDPGGTENPMGPIFLAEGQHLYRLGWHKMSDMKRVFLALKPLSNGVLVVRSKDMALTEADLAGGLERNNAINIHWGGEGLRNVGRWSSGTQVICGKGYINHNDVVINCSEYAATYFDQIGTMTEGGVYQTKGAYTMLMDLILAFRQGDDNLVNYFLMKERDLNLSPEI
jgi:hypothetical protein